MKQETVEAEKWQTRGCETEIYCAALFQSVEKSKAILWSWALSCFVRLLQCIPLWAKPAESQIKAATDAYGELFEKYICHFFRRYPISTG